MAAGKNRKGKIYVLNGPNLNLLGLRQPEIYGHTTLEQIREAVCQSAERQGWIAEFRQTNHEGELVGWLQESRERAAGVILNAAAYTHTSVAIHDALHLVGKPIIEIHLSNPHAREPFRHHSYVSSVAKGVIAGFGMNSYLLAVDAMAYILG